jgi:hypothetical protein
MARLPDRFICFGCDAVCADVSVKLEGDQLRVAAPQLHFLGSEVLQRLHNGIAVNYVFKIGITPNRYSKPTTETSYRFIISYDIFEEKFAVSRIEPNPRSITHLSEAAAQLWCLDSISLSTTGLAADQSFWVTMEYQSVEPKPTTESGDPDRTLIDASRKAQREESRGTIMGGPFSLRIPQVPLVLLHTCEIPARFEFRPSCETSPLSNARRGISVPHEEDTFSH